MPLIGEALIEKHPDITVRCYSNLAKLHPGEGTDDFDYSLFDESRVELHDPIPQKQFAKQMARAGLMILPSDYPEICSNVVLQALACGTPIVTTGNMGATPEWVRHGRNGFLTLTQPHDFVVHRLEILRYAMNVLDNEKRHRRMIRKAAKTKVLSWDDVGKLWDRFIRKL